MSGSDPIIGLDGPARLSMAAMDGPAGLSTAP